jgi:hypothetical protein
VDQNNIKPNLEMKSVDQSNIKQNKINNKLHSCKFSKCSRIKSIFIGDLTNIWGTNDSISKSQGILAKHAISLCGS